MNCDKCKKEILRGPHGRYFVCVNCGRKFCPDCGNDGGVCGMCFDEIKKKHKVYLSPSMLCNIAKLEFREYNDREE